MTDESKFFEAKLGKQTLVFQKNAEQEQKILNESLKNYEKNLNEKAKLEQKFFRQVLEYQQAGLDEEADRARASYMSANKERLDAEAALEKARQSLKQKAVDTSMMYEIAQFKKMSASQRAEYSKNVSDKLKEELAATKRKQEADKAAYDAADKIVKSRSKSVTKEQREQAKKERDELKKSLAESSTKEKSLSEQQKSAQNMATKFSASDLLDKDARATKRKNAAEISKQEVDSAAEETQKKRQVVNSLEKDWEKQNASRSKKIQDAKEKGDKVELANLKAQEAAERANWEKKSGYLKAQEELEEANSKEQQARLKDIGTSLKNSIGNIAEGMADVATIDANLDAIFGDQAKYIAKLQGSTEDWRKSVDNVSDAIGFSGIVSKKNVITKMKELVDSGIAYNIELRAFLAETSANIAATFDATNGTLLRIIRLQQQDSTAARLGMEATLTRLFNEYFQDTSYLANNISEAVSGAILDASATMSRDQSLEFEYTMQKWLGSLYSLGMSDQAIQTIATGINYLGTGNVSALNGDSSLQTLLAMSASRSGGRSYAELLTNGLTSEETNKLLKSMIEYLAEIARSQENKVTKSAFAELFGMSVTDLATFASLTEYEINSLYDNTVSYQSLMNETSSRLSQISKNMSLSDIVNYAIENAEVGVATTIGGNAFTYGTWKALGLLDKYVGEIKIPGVTGMGTGIASGLDLLNLAQTGMVGIGLLGSLLGGLGSMMNGGPTNLNMWDFSETVQRGGGMSALNAGSYSGTSYSAVLGTGSSSASDIESTTLKSGQDSAYEAAGTTSEEQEEQKEIPQKIYEALAGTESDSVISLLTDINDKLAPERVFYTAIAGVLSSNAVDKVTNLSAQLSVAGLQNLDTSEDRLDKAGQSKTASVSSRTLEDALITHDEQTSDMYTTILNAVSEAINNLTIGSGLKVEVTNMGSTMGGPLL